MPNYRRLFVPGGTYFFTLNLADRRRDLLVRYIHDFRQSWRDTVRRWPFETVAAVILPDHVHMIIALPPGDHDFPVRLRTLKSGFTRRLPESEKRSGRKGERGIWQQRYWEHAVRDEADLEALVSYLHFNPVKHGYVTTSEEWPYSTFHRNPIHP